MLAALLKNNNNARQQAGFKIDSRASGGRSRHDRPDRIDGIDGGGDGGGHYSLVDIIAAAATFPEIAGEDATARVARRYRWISEALPFVKEAREKREEKIAAVAFLTGAQLGAATERAEIAAQDRLKIEQIVKVIDEVRNAPPPFPRVSICRGRGTTPAGIGASGPVITLGLVLGGVMIGSLISAVSR